MSAKCLHLQEVMCLRNTENYNTEKAEKSDLGTASKEGFETGL